MTPLTSSTRTSPRATAAALRPSWATDCIRVRGPGSTQDQKSRSPTPAATNTAVSSRMPCGRISPKNSDPRPWSIISAPITATLRMLDHSRTSTGMPSTPRAMHSAATQALLVHTWAAKCEAAYSL